jgi:hypothetical protein
MNKMAFVFQSESAHAGFLNWLRAFARENKIETNDKILFSRDQFRPEYSRWTLAPSCKFDDIWNGALAFGFPIVETKQNT